MKKMLVFVLLALIPLSGCSSSPRHADIAEIYQNASELSAQMTITALTDVIAEYDISYRLTGGAAEVTILRPEVLEGVTAQLKPGSALISYDGVAAEMLLPGIPGFTPIDAMHGLLYDLANSVPQDTGLEQGMAALTYSTPYGEQLLEKRVRLDAQTFAVCACEFYVDGQMVMRMQVVSINIF